MRYGVWNKSKDFVFLRQCSVKSTKTYCTVKVVFE